MSLFGQSSSTPASTGGSLFANLNAGTNAEQQPKRRTSIFAPSGETAQQQSGLFGNTSASSASTSSIFGGAATTSSGGSLFGSTTTTAPASGGLFANLGQNTSSTQSSSGGLFANLGQNGTSKPASGGLFGSNTSAQPASGGMANAGGTSGPGATFGQTAGSSFYTIGPAAQPGQQPPPQEQGQSRDASHFSSLLERQKKKPRHANGMQNGRLGQLPNLNMDLGDIARRAQEIGGRGAKATAVNGKDSRAHYLLAGSGVAPGKAYREFQNLEGEAGVNNLPPTEPFDPDTGKYIRDLQKKGREAMIRESMDRVNADFDTFLEESLNINFDEQRKKIMQHFGLIPKSDEDDEGPARSSPVPGAGGFGKSSRVGRSPFKDSAKDSTRSVFGRSAMERSMIGIPGAGANTMSFFGEDQNVAVPNILSKGQNERHLRDKERLFVESVTKLNQARMQEKVYPIVQEFGQVESTAGGDNPKQLADAFQALRDIVKENTSAVTASDPAAIRERRYASTYLDENERSPKVIKLRKQILDGSRAYLEKAFYKELESLIDKNPREAQLGGRPTTINKIRAYIRVRSTRRDLAPDGAELQQIGGENGDYCWIIIFYLIRCGFTKEAADYVSNDAAFQSTDKRFVSYMTTYANSPERKLSRKLQEMINGEYQQRLRNAPEHTVDPYRMACYKIVGRCDLTKRNLDVVGQGVEDWIWLQFSLAREFERIEELSGEVFGLEQICETLREIGQKHFQKKDAEASGGYGTFFLMQILAGMFEEAVAYLHPFNAVSSVHFAIALAYYGLLRVSDFQVAGNELLTRTTSDRPQINFVPLVAHYTGTFRTALPNAAVDYLALICLNSDLIPASLGAAQTSACHETLRQLCLETREFAKLLGDIHSDGTRIAGSIELRAKLIHLSTHEDFLKSITLQAAGIADERGQIADAVLLYHLSEDYDAVISILNRALADACTLDLGESPINLQPLRPRADTTTPDTELGTTSSLSLTQCTNSPTTLATNMVTLYNSDASYYSKISATNRQTTGALLQLLSARSSLEADPPQYMAALETLNALAILPLKAGGSIPAIRSAATAFASLPALLARCAGVSVVWAITAIGREREVLTQEGGWDGGYGDDRKGVEAQLSAMAKDLMVFAGLVKYKLPARVYDMLTRVGGEVGAY